MRKSGRRSDPRHAKTRVEIPPVLSARVLFMSDRTCCVCRAKGKSVQIHHIDDDPSNCTFENLAVLCLDCHTETQVRGGFHRKLDSDQVTLYRDDWIAVVGRERAAARTIASDQHMSEQSDLELATSIAEIYRDADAHEQLAMHYLTLGNTELRDKYIELAIESGMDDASIIFYRSEQNRVDLIPEEVVRREERRLLRHKNFFQVARLYRSLNRRVEAVQMTCRGALEAIASGNMFTAAYYLKEMAAEGDIQSLFELAFEEAKKSNDLWWQVRALQEMDMDGEADRLLKANREQIESGAELHLRQALALTEGDERRFIELSKNEAREECDFLKKRRPRSNQAGRG